MKYLIKYGFVGAVATLIHGIVATLVVYFFSMDVIFANWLAFSIAVFFSYIGNTKFVFKRQIGHINFIKFFMVSIITVIVITTISYFGKTYQMNTYVIILIISIMIPCITFILHKTWTFRS